MRLIEIITPIGLFITFAGLFINIFEKINGSNGIFGHLVALIGLVLFCFPILFWIIKECFSYLTNKDKQDGK